MVGTRKSSSYSVSVTCRPITISSAMLLDKDFFRRSGLAQPVRLPAKPTRTQGWRRRPPWRTPLRAWTTAWRERGCLNRESEASERYSFPYMHLLLLDLVPIALSPPQRVEPPLWPTLQRILTRSTTKRFFQKSSRLKSQAFYKSLPFKMTERLRPLKRLPPL